MVVAGLQKKYENEIKLLQEKVDLSNKDVQEKVEIQNCVLC